MCDESLRGNLSFSPPYGAYGGEYEVTPGLEPQTLPTKGKFLSEDILVHGIPYSEVTNQANGLTVHIATKEG